MTPTAQLVFNTIVRWFHRVGPGLRKPATVALVSFTELALLPIPVQGCRCLIHNWQLAAGSNSYLRLLARPGLKEWGDKLSQGF